MKALFISNDPTIFDATSIARARMRAYAAAIGELHIVSVATADAREEKAGNLFLHPIHVLKIFSVSPLAKRVRELIINYCIDVVSPPDPF